MIKAKVIIPTASRNLVLLLPLYSTLMDVIQNMWGNDLLGGGLESECFFASLQLHKS